MHGPDGISGAGWKAAGIQGATTLWMLGARFLSGISIGLAFNESLSNFPQKGELDSDEHEVIRKPIDTRMLGLKNEDNKEIVGVLVSLCQRASQATWFC